MSSLFSDTYVEIDAKAAYESRDKGSRFYAFSFIVFQESEVKIHLNELKSRYPDATHHCYAYIIGQGQEAQRANDDGEPSNSAGRPILRAIISQGLTNVLVVVVRYFGGTLLGIPGLINAYGEAAKGVLLLSRKVQKIQEDFFEIFANFDQETRIHQLLKPFEVRIIQRNYTERVHYIVGIRRSLSTPFQLAAEKAYPLEVKSSSIHHFD